jgi:hypothetical protein
LNIIRSPIVVSLLAHACVCEDGGTGICPELDTPLRPRLSAPLHTTSRGAREQMGVDMTRRARQDSIRTAASLLNELDLTSWLTAGSTTRRPEGPGTAVYPGTPLNSSVYEHVKAADSDVADYIARARAAGVAGPDPRPGDRAAVYAEAHRAAEALGGSWESFIEAQELRTALESELLMGDTDVIREQPCPACHTWGLVWSRRIKRARCINARCAQDAAGDKPPTPLTWTVAQLAVAATARRTRRAAR